MSEEEDKHEIVGNQLNRYGLYDLQELNHQEVNFQPLVHVFSTIFNSPVFFVNF